MDDVQGRGGGETASALHLVRPKCPGETEQFVPEPRQDVMYVSWRGSPVIVAWQARWNVSEICQIYLV